MAKTITFDITRKGTTKDIAHVRGEALILTTPDCPAGALVQIAIGETSDGAPVLVLDGTTHISPDTLVLGGLREGQIYHYNAWLNTGGALTLLARGRYRQIASIEPTDVGAPTVTQEPQITGSFVVGQTLILTSGQWQDAPDLTTQWTRDDAPVPGQTGASYTVTPQDEGTVISAQITAATASGQTVRRAQGGGRVVWPAPVASATLPDLIWDLDQPVAVSIATGFQGDGLTYALAPASPPLPTGVTLNAAGMLVGTPTGIATPALIVIRCTNSGGHADAAFQVTVGATATVSVGSTAIGQSNMLGTNALSDVPTEDQGVYPRVRMANARHLNVPSDPAFQPLTIVPAGIAKDGVTGPVPETAGGSGISAITGAARLMTTGGSAAEWIVVKRAEGGQAQAAFLPGGTAFNTLDAMMTNITDPYVRGTPTRWSDILYAQGERDATDAVTATEASLGSSDPASVMSLALADSVITDWAQAHTNLRRAQRDYLGTAQMPYVILGQVLPDATTGYATNSERAREGVAQQQLNLCRWLVRLSATGDTITLTDLAGPAARTEWDAGTDKPVTAQIGAAHHRDDNSYYIDARGYASADRLHHDVAAQYRIGQALMLLRRSLYGADAIPPISHEITAIRPIFIQTPNVTARTANTLDVICTPSQAGTVHLGAWPAAATPPSVAQLIAGSGAIFKTSASGAKRSPRTVTLSNMPAGASVDLYALLDTVSGASVIFADAGVVAGQADVPAAFAASDWTLSDGQNGDRLDVGITALPANGGSPITDIAYQIESGALVSTGGTGGFAITGLTQGTATSITLFATNAQGIGPTSDTKVATPTVTTTAFSHNDLPAKAAWITARGMTIGDVSDAAALSDGFGVSTLTPLNVDNGATFATVSTDIGGQPTLLIRGHASNNGASGRQRLDIGHGDLGDSFTMAILARRDIPSTGQFVAVGADNARDGVRSAFYFANKTGVGGYGAGAQWDLASTQPIPAGDTGVHLMVITSDGSQSGAKTRLWIDGIEDTSLAAPGAVPSWTDVTRIGVGASGSTNNYDLYFTDFIILNAALGDTALRQKMEGRMAWDAGRPDLLPATHPYASAAP